MQPFRSVKSLANNLSDPSIREALLRLDSVMQELYASVVLLSSGKKANSSNEEIGNGS